MINWHVSKAEHESIMRIVERVLTETESGSHMRINKRILVMDLTACHANGCPLKLEELAKAEKFDLTHDVFGIMGHINRSTGQLEDCFLPRYAAS